MNSVTSGAVAAAQEYFPTSHNESGTKIKATNVEINPRSAGLVTLNIKNESNTGLSIDFDYNAGQVRVYSINNGSVVGQKNIALS